MSRKKPKHNLENKNSAFYEINHLEMSINELKHLLIRTYKTKFNQEERKLIEKHFEEIKSYCQKTRFEMFRLKFLYSEEFVPDKNEFNETVLEEMIDSCKNKYKKKLKI